MIKRPRPKQLDPNNETIASSSSVPTIFGSTSSSSIEGTTHPEAKIRRLQVQVALVAGVFLACLLVLFMTPSEKRRIYSQQSKKKTSNISQTDSQPSITTSIRILPNDCCPFAKTMYGDRYSKINNRCCTDRLSSLEELRRPLEFDWTQAGQTLANKTIMVQGDSLAEQHFISLLCYIWTFPAEIVRVTNLTLTAAPKPNRFDTSGTKWQATIEPFGTTLRYVRWNVPKLCPSETYLQDDYLILGGWHHGELPNLEAFVKQIQKVRRTNNNNNNNNNNDNNININTRRHFLPENTLLTEALPGHFPGGRYRPSNVEPVITPKYRNQNPLYAVCDSHTNVGDPDITGKQERLANQYNMTLLRTLDAYQGRGDAHIGKIPKDVLGHRERDCLHWCIESLDTLAYRTWKALSSYDGTRG